MLEAKFAQAGHANNDDLDLYQRTTGNLRRVLETLGLQRRAKNITPDLQTYLRMREAAAVEDGEDAEEVVDD
jgi:hypothetical protein